MSHGPETRDDGPGRRLFGCVHLTLADGPLPAFRSGLCLAGSRCVNRLGLHPHGGVSILWPRALGRSMSIVCPSLPGAMADGWSMVFDSLSLCRRAKSARGSAWRRDSRAHEGPGARLTGGVFPGRGRGAERRRVTPDDIGKGPQTCKWRCTWPGRCMKTPVRHRAREGAGKASTVTKALARHPKAPTGLRCPEASGNGHLRRSRKRGHLEAIRDTGWITGRRRNGRGNGQTANKEACGGIPDFFW